MPAKGTFKIDPDNLKKFMRLKPTLRDTAAFFDCSERTVERFIRDHHDSTFVEFRDKNMVHTRHALVRKAIDKALAGDNCMLIFCLKNLCGWADRKEVEHKGDSGLSIEYKVKEPKE